MDKNTIRYTSFVIGILSRILGSNFKVGGVEKIPKKPVLFVANHFTRSETFFLPYLIYEKTGRQVRCLADSSLFHGLLGRFLRSVGAISTKEPNRDRIILDDLINGHYDWMIYPEGKMIKNKKIEHRRGYSNLTPDRIDRIRTGSAVLALKSEIYRQDIIGAYQSENTKLLNFFKKNFDLVYNEKMVDLNTAIVPLSVTYYPLRPGKNSIQNLFSRLVKNIPQQIMEELEIEGNLLLSAEIDVHFGDPIFMRDIVKKIKAPIYQLPIISNDFKSNLVIRYYKQKLTNQFMTSIYHDIEINFDHIFAALLGILHEEKISIKKFKQIIFLAALTIRKLGKYRLNKSLLPENLIKMFNDEKLKYFDEVLDLAIKQKIITISNNNEIKVNSDIYSSNDNFHEIRRENSLRVVANEFLILNKANLVLKKITNDGKKDLSYRVFQEIYNYDKNIYENDYQSYFDPNFSKDKNIGAPFTINCDSKKEDIGILLVHGYKSAPKEVEEIANFFKKFGFKIYAVRLKGHGTAPINMKFVEWRDWHNSVNIGYSALNNICKKIIIIGFSTGGLLSLFQLIKKTPKKHNIVATVVINSALRLRDIRSHFVPGINIWNDFLEKFKIEKAKFEFIDSIPENPHINYARNYLNGVEELGKLMDKVEDNLDKVSGDLLIIQADNDPIVNPSSSEIIFKKINCNKDLQYVSSDKHVIINNPKFQEKTFELIEDFLLKLKLIKS